MGTILFTLALMWGYSRLYYITYLEYLELEEAPAISPPEVTYIF